MGNRVPFGFRAIVLALRRRSFDEPATALVFDHLRRLFVRGTFPKRDGNDDLVDHLGNEYVLILCVRGDFSLERLGFLARHAASLLSGVTPGGGHSEAIGC